jgi:hypothetical protein
VLIDAAGSFWPVSDSVGARMDAPKGGCMASQVSELAEGDTDKSGLDSVCQNRSYLRTGAITGIDSS